jgi:DinB superfamily
VKHLLHDRGGRQAEFGSMACQRVSESTLARLVLRKISEQIDRARHLVNLAPPNKLDWRPVGDSMALGEVLGHLLECLAGFCATLYPLYPDDLAHFARLRGLTVNHRCSPDEALRRIDEYETCIEQGFALLSDADLTRTVPTLFSPQGEPVLSILLDNLEHLINHKYQLFLFLKMLGGNVTTPDLYVFRPEGQGEKEG